MESIVSPSLFYVTAFVIVFGALGMVISRNLFHSALYMLLTFIGVSGLYATIHESFFAVVQIMVYVGAIAIFVIFGIMLTNSHGHRLHTNPFSKTAVGGGIVATSLCVLISLAIRTVEFVPALPIDVPAVRLIGIGLFGIHILPTELAAVLLLIAMIGAVMISWEGEGEK